MKAFKIFLFVLTAYLITDCESYPINPAPAKYQLVGEWLWLSRTGGITGGTITPNEGTKQTIKFSPDSLYSVYSNDSLIYRYNFNMQKKRTIYSVDSLDVICFQSMSMSGQRVILRLTYDTLMLGDNLVDGYTYLYKKVE